MLRFPFIFFASLLMCSSLSAHSTVWKSVNWEGEAAWSSQRGDTLAIVSVARTRLIYFGKATGNTNALCAPSQQAIREDKESSPNWGGQRFWLGPQKRWSWPPLPEWEHREAEISSAKGDLLVLVHEQLSEDYPRLTRTYAWDAKGLRCSVAWHDDGRPYFGMHVFAIKAPTTLSVKLKAWDLVPAGWVEIRGDVTIPDKVSVNNAFEAQGNHALITSGRARLKAGFYPQELRAQTAAGTLVLTPAENKGQPLATPDFGYTSQVWVGAYEPFAELEQLTPYLQGGADGLCESTVWLRLE